MSKKCSYVSPSVDTVEVDTDINVCAMSGHDGGDKPGGDGDRPGWGDDEDYDDDSVI